ncbi:MAG: hypothetical protein LBP33_06930 [Candidatus Adiutrix sp.]|jgi:hypothetical protein|nr:hypothetical protein [Candidatus Adiutrix sp.]
MNHTLSRTGLYFFAACFLAWSLFSPGGAMAANTTINDNTSGPYTGLYGNDGTATTPTADTYASGNMLVLGNGYTGPTITDTSVVTVAGGYAPGNSNGDSSSNTLTINSGTSFTATGFTNIYGGRVAAGSGNAAGNTVTMGDFTQGSGNVVVYGGRAHGSGNASTNGVTIGSGNTNDFSGIYGAYANSGNAISNTVTINGGGQIAFVNGGYSADGNAGGSGVGNVVNISGGNANILNGIGGGNSNSGSSGSASYNEVNIGSGYTGTIGGNVHGGWVSGGSGNAEHNSVTIAGGTLQGGAAVIGGHSTNGAATDNTVSISGGRVAGDIRGGSTTTGSATGNTVSITTTGETYLNIYGGYGGG